MCTTYQVKPRKKTEQAIMVKKIATMQQCSTENGSAVDPKRLINFKMSISQSVSAVLRQSV